MEHYRPCAEENSKLDLNNYRPFIAIRNLGKILESVVIGNVMSDIDTNDPDAIHSFRTERLFV